jgi:4-hydroxybenzoate polyprenyltransferase
MTMYSHILGLKSPWRVVIFEVWWFLGIDTVCAHYDIEEDQEDDKNHLAASKDIFNLSKGSNWQ